MKKKIIIVIILTLIAALLIFTIYKFISGFKEDKKLTIEKSNEIIEEFNKFNESVLTFAKERDNIYTLRENTYLEDFAKNIDGWNKLMETHKQNLENIENNSEKLKENCVVKFADPNVNSKCTIFKSTYEAANNYYISDIKDYNKTVEEYNEWAEKSNKDKLNKIELTIHKDYIDYDKDKEYFGKEEESNE